MVHRPPVLILDEPTAGVDIELRQHLWSYVRELNDAGVTIVLTTHYLEEAEELCDRIAIINHGEVVACEEKDKLLSRIAEKEVTIKVAEEVRDLPAPLKAMSAYLNGSNSFTIQYDSQTMNISGVLNAVSEAGFTITDLSTRETDLEDIFLQLTSQRVA